MRFRAAWWIACAIALLTWGCKRSTDTPDQPVTAPVEPAPVEPAPPPGLLDVSDEHIAQAIKSFASDEWYGCYIADRKVGYGRGFSRPSEPHEAGGYASGMSIVFKSSGLEDENEEIRVGLVEYYDGKPPFGLVSVRAYEESPEGRQERVVTRTDDGLALDQTIDGVQQPRRTLAPSAATVTPILVELGAFPENFVTGREGSYKSFDMDKQRDETHRLWVEDVRDEKLAGVTTRVTRLKLHTEGESTPMDIEVAGGVMTRMTIGGMVIKLEDKALAQSSVAGFNVFTFSVPVDRKLGEPSELRELKLTMSAPDDVAIPDRPNQKVTRAAPGRFELHIKAAPGSEVTPEQRAKALDITSTVDADHPDIKHLSDKLTREATTVKDKVHRLQRWVYRNVNGDLSTNLSTASQVLAKRTGDCTEYSLLFIALARAARIPAREVSGLVYMGDEFGQFGWHAWAEVEIDGKWVQVDPSWDEDVANPTHIKLGEGDEDESIKALGAIAIEALEPL